MKNKSSSADDSFVRALSSAGVTLGVSTYNASQLLTVWANDYGLCTSTSNVPRAMGIGFENDLLAVASRAGMSMFRCFETSQVSNNGIDADFTWLERAKYHTGPIDTHDVEIHNRRIFAVNTAWSCISVFGFEDNFKPIWRPPFITGLCPNDRCHLNGMAVKDGKPMFVTALGQSNEPKGWKAGIVNGGVLMSTKENKILAKNLSLPHSPVYMEHSNCLWFLQSGTGQICQFDLLRLEIVKTIDTSYFIRGLAIEKDIAFVGFSMLRKSSQTFKPLQGILKGDECGLLAVNLVSGEVLGKLLFSSPVEELYDVSIFPKPGRHIVISEGDALHKEFYAKGNDIIRVKPRNDVASWPG